MDEKHNNILSLLALFFIFLLVVGCNKSESDNTAVPAQVKTVEEAVVGAETTPSETSEVKTVTMEAFNWGFKVDAPTIKKGDTVKLVVKSTSGNHGVGIPDFDVSTDVILVGETKEVTFVADKAGSFTYFCNVPCGKGHKEMKGTLVVEE